MTESYWNTCMTESYWNTCMTESYWNTCMTESYWNNVAIFCNAAYALAKAGLDFFQVIRIHNLHYHALINCEIQ